MTEHWVLRGLQVILVIAAITLTILYFKTMRRNQTKLSEKFVPGFIIGFIADFGDTIGIGSFTTTTVMFKGTKWLDDDRRLPGTMNAAHAIPVFIEALFFLTSVKIEITTLIPMTLAAVIGALVGTRITANWPVRKMQRGLSIGLALAALAMLIKLLTNPGHAEAMTTHGLHGWLLVIGLVVNFTLGILMTIGLGNYTPELIFFSLVGVNPLVAFPVMMMDAAMILFTSTLGFLKTGRIEWRGLPGIAIGGVLGVIVAAKLVTNINITILSYFIVALALYTAFNLFRDSRKPEPADMVADMVKHD